MPNPTDIVKVNPALCAASTTSASIPLDPMLAYSLIHMGKDVAGADDVNAVFFTNGETAPAATYATSGNKGVLRSGDPPTPIGPGWSAIAFKTASGAPAFQLTPLARY